MKIFTRVLLASVIYVSLLMGIANAQTYCTKNKEIVYKYLQDSYNESIIITGMVDNGEFMEILVSPEGTWSIMSTNIDGLTCVIGTGEAWEFIRPTIIEDKNEIIS